MIFGDQYCKDSSSILTKIREKYRNAKDYRIINYTYPDAPAEYILQSVRSDVQSLTENDWVIMCLGSNDTNPTKLLIEISAILKTISKPKIIVSGIAHNPYLNGDKINHSLKTIVHNQKNCTYLHVAPINNTLIHTMRFNKRINDIINTHDYEACFLGKNITKQRNPTTVRPSPATIPYFFNKMRSACHRNQEKSKNYYKTDTSPKPGTIPFYFNKTTTTHSTSPNNDRKQFFRV